MERENAEPSEVAGTVAQPSAAELLTSAEALLASAERLLEHGRNLARQRGENFNVFRLLDLEWSENRLHSRFIKELLDPHGSHEQGKTFLDLFLSQVGKTDWIRTGDARVQREWHIAGVGRIDIFITDGDRHLSIENKIGAEEGEEQVHRYCNYDRKHNCVLFLTLDGRKAKSTQSNDSYSPISYSRHVLPWLEDCERRVADFSILRETIKQYLVTVRKLTGGLVMHETAERLNRLVAKHHAAARRISEAYGRAVEEAGRELACTVRKRLREKLDDDGPSGICIECAPRKKLACHAGSDAWGSTQVRWEDVPGWYGIWCPKGNDGRERWEGDLRTRLREQFPELKRSDQESPNWGLIPPGWIPADGVIALRDNRKRAELAENIAELLFELVLFCETELRGERGNAP